MEIKADEQSQAWARSARHVLNITNESIAETLIALNEQATKQGRQTGFCVDKLHSHAFSNSHQTREHWTSRTLAEHIP